MIDCCIAYACSDIDGTVIVNENFPKWRRYTILACLILMGLSTVVSFIFGLLLFIRLTPYYFYGKVKALKIYFVSLAFCVVCIISFILFLVFLCKSFKRQKSHCLFMVFNFFCWISIALSFMCYFWGAESIKNEFVDNDPCSAPLIDCYNGIQDRVHKNKLDYEFWMKFEKWFLELDKDNICGNVLVPMLIIEIIQFAIYIVFSSFIGGCCCCNSMEKVENDSEEQNQNESNSYALQDTNNQNMNPNQNNLNQLPNQNYQPNENMQNAQTNQTEQSANPVQTFLA